MSNLTAVVTAPRASAQGLLLVPRARQAAAVSGAAMNPTISKDNTAGLLAAVGKKRERDTSAQRHLFFTYPNASPVVMDSRPPKRTYASFLADFVDPVHPHVPRTSTSLRSLVSEWLESVGSDQPKRRRCRSSSPLHDHLENGSVLRKPARSLPDMASARDADGFALPSMPASATSRSSPVGVDPRSITASDISQRSPGRSLVEDPLYRFVNLAQNGIHFRGLDQEYPIDIANLVREVGKNRDSPGPSPEQVRNDAALYNLEMDGGEPDVEEYFRSNIYPFSDPTGALQRRDRQPISKHAVPNTGSKNRLMYPFLAIELKADGPLGPGGIWVATNQCLGASASCVNVAERLNRQLRLCNDETIRPINSAAFGIAMNATEARLFISWKHSERDYYTRKVRGFLLQDPDHFIEFRRHVNNILDWGKNERLNDIRRALDHIQQESRKMTSRPVKARPSPSASESSSGAKRQKPSPNMPDLETYWTWHETLAKWYHICSDGSIVWGEQAEDPSPAEFVGH
ncbi:hypothetical protein B0T19DRAFT_482849 [Cercophora scortea]|uniref:DUF7924 domain-containing protein n=1 Tax=Cercophora scortea TaxID=314031 RepID=A0AAE0MHE9_9PEZI|nr:hypothetical protein B0T19DRAFT_482849 [Cercophora scortea]